MNEDIPIFPLLLGALSLLLFSVMKLSDRRHKLRQDLNVFDQEEESEIAAMLEVMVASGQLKPHSNSELLS